MLSPQAPAYESPHGKRQRRDKALSVMDELNSKKFALLQHATTLRGVPVQELETRLARAQTLMKEAEVMRLGLRVGVGVGVGVRVGVGGSPTHHCEGFRVRSTADHGGPMSLVDFPVVRDSLVLLLLQVDFLLLTTQVRRASCASGHSIPSHCMFDATKMQTSCSVLAILFYRGPCISPLPLAGRFLLLHWPLLSFLALSYPPVLPADPMHWHPALRCDSFHNDRSPVLSDMDSCGECLRLAISTAWGRWHHRASSNHGVPPFPIPAGRLHAWARECDEDASSRC